MSRVPDMHLSPPVMIATFPESLPDMVPYVRSGIARLPECNDVTNKEKSEPGSAVFVDSLLTFPSSTNIPRWLPCVHAGCCSPKLSKLSGIPRASGWAGDVGGPYGIELDVTSDVLIVFVTSPAQKRLKAIWQCRNTQSNQNLHGQQSTGYPSSMRM